MFGRRQLICRVGDFIHNARVTKATGMAWGDHENLVLSTLQNMRESKFLTDVIIECEGKEFAAHRAILCAAIPFFHAMYQAGMEEALSDKVKLQSITPEATTVVLDFVYTGNITLLGEDVQLYEDVLHATHLLQIDYLFRTYLERFTTLLSETHFARILTTVELYNNEELSYVMTYLTMNFFQISASDDFLLLTISQMKLLLGHPELKKECTDVVVQGILRWVKFDESVRCSHLEELFSFITADDITLAYLQVLLNRETLVTNCQPLFSKLVSAVLSKLNDFCSESQLMCFGRGEYNKVMTVYSLERRSWSPAIELTFNVQSAMGVVEYLGHIYFIGGGSTRACHASSSVYKYNPSLNETVQLKDLVVPVNQPGVGVLDDQLYVVGGRAIEGHSTVITKTVQRVDPSSGYSVLVASTIELHNSPYVLPFQGNLYVVGSSRDSSDAVERYNSQANQWTIITNVPESVDLCHATLWRDQLVVMCTPDDDRLYLYNFNTDAWDWVNIPSNAPIESIRGIWSTNCKRYKKPVLLIQDSSSMLHTFDPDTDAWKNLPGRISVPWYWKISAFKN